MVAALAQAGNNTLVDHLLQDDGALEECVENWVGLNALFVGVKCPLKIAKEREEKHGDRTIGTARSQCERIHAHDLYDLEIDTSRLNVDECVTRIIELIIDKPKESAFQELVKRFMIGKANTLPCQKRANTAFRETALFPFEKRLVRQPDRVYWTDG